MRFVRIVAIGSVLSCVGVASAWAGHPQERKGFWIALGFGYGWANASCSLCEGADGDGASTGLLRMGWALNQKVLLGGEFDFWWKDRDVDTLFLYDPVLTVTFYPRETSGLFVRGGIGGAGADTGARIGNTTVTTELGSGLGLLAGAGYDIRVGRKISITPALTYWTGRSMDLRFEGTTATEKWHHGVVDITVAVTFH
jgi:hypothetical protein